MYPLHKWHHSPPSHPSVPPSRPFPSSPSPLPSLLGSPGFTRRICSVIAQDNCILRYCLKLYDYCSTDAYKFSFFPRTVVQWNNLPASIAMTPSLGQFKGGLADRLVTFTCWPLNPPPPTVGKVRTIPRSIRMPNVVAVRRSCRNKGGYRQT